MMHRILDDVDAAPWRPRTAGRLQANTVDFLLATICFVVFLGPVVVRNTVITTTDAPPDTSMLRLLAAPLTLLGLWFMARNPARAIDITLRSVALFVLIAFAGLSVLWSVDPGTSLMRTIALVMVAVATMGLATRFSAVQIAQVAAVACTFCCVLSLLLWLGGDPLAKDFVAGGVRGAFTHKNVLGTVAAVTVVLGVGLVLAPGAAWIGLISVTAGVLALAVANSATGIVAAGACLGIFAVLTMLGSRRIPPFLKAATIVLGVVGALIAILAAPALLDLVGRDATLTGRDEVWRFTWVRIEERPWLGWGFRAYWTAPSNSGLIAAYFWNRYDQAHNGYLQLLLDLGAIGLGLFLVWVATVAVAALRGLHSPGVRIWFTVIAIMMIYAMSEAVFLAPTGFSWMVMALAGSAVLAETAPQRRPQPSEPLIATPTSMRGGGG